MPGIISYLNNYESFWSQTSDLRSTYIICIKCKLYHSVHLLQPFRGFVTTTMWWLNSLGKFLGPLWSGLPTLPTKIGPAPHSTPSPSFAACLKAQKLSPSPWCFHSCCLLYWQCLSPSAWRNSIHPSRRKHSVIAYLCSHGISQTIYCIPTELLRLVFIIASVLTCLFLLLAFMEGRCHILLILASLVAM